MNTASPLLIPAHNCGACTVPEGARVVAVPAEGVPRQIWMLTPECRKGRCGKPDPAQTGIRVWRFNPAEPAAATHDVRHRAHLVVVKECGTLAPPDPLERRHVLPGRIPNDGRTIPSFPEPPASGEPMQRPPPPVRIGRVHDVTCARCQLRRCLPAALITVHACQRTVHHSTACSQ